MPLTKPFIGSWMDEEEIAFRNAAEGNLARAIELGLIPGARPDSFTPFATGTSSVVFKIETSDGPRVVKMCHKQDIILKEAAFLKAWAAVGVGTPAIFITHVADEKFPFAFIVMEYIDKPILNVALSREELISSGVAREMGRTLALMHSLHGEGFGPSTAEDPARGRYESLSQDLEQAVGKFSPFLLENNIIEPKDLEFVRQAIDVLERDFTERGMPPSLIHGDYQTHNIFYSQPIIIFDPGTRISHPMIDMGLTILRPLVNSKTFGQKEVDEILTGYAERSAINEKALNAGAVVQSIHLLHTWNKRDKGAKADRLKLIFKSYQERL